MSKEHINKNVLIQTDPQGSSILFISLDSK